MVQRKKILVLESETLLAAGLLSLLTARVDLDVSHTTASSLAALDRPGTFRADVVILEEALLVANLSAVIRLADRRPHLRLIVFRLGDNRVHVFDRQIMRVRQVDELLELL